MPTAAPADISDPRLDPDQFYARLGRLFAEMMGPMIAQRIQQLMAHRKLEEAVALLDNEDEVARVVSDCSDLLELRILERELETLRRRQQQRNRVQRPRAKTKLRQATRIARQELLVEARANDILYSALEPTFQRIAREAKAEFENYQQSADSKKNVPGLDQLHIISRLIEAAPALFPETIHRAILDDLEALRLGGKPSLFRPANAIALRTAVGHFPYQQGFVVQNIDSTPGYEMIEFNQGLFLELGQAIGGVETDIMRAMIFKTVEQHLRKERALKGRGIKVLTLFFIDKVANYRVYNADGSVGLGPIGLWFEEAFRELTAKPMFKDLLSFEVDQLHNGYFSQDKKKQFKDTRGNTADDEDTYALIMRDKERLLDPKEPLRFIFSHTALREGWDNPNVFQICTLREVGTELERRQQIGRGLRLPVNDQGERVHDEHLNRLTVIAGESYKDFAAALHRFIVEALSFGEIEIGVKYPRVVARKGKAPPQYPSKDDEDYDEED